MQKSVFQTHFILDSPIRKKSRFKLSKLNARPSNKLVH